MVGSQITVLFAIVATEFGQGAVHQTVNSLVDFTSGTNIMVLDAGGDYQPIRGEKVFRVHDVTAENDIMRLTHDRFQYEAALTMLFAGWLLQQNHQPVIAVAGGITFDVNPVEVFGDDGSTTIVITQPTTARGLPTDAVSYPSIFTTKLFQLGTGALPAIDQMLTSAPDWRTAALGLDRLVTKVPHRILSSTQLSNQIIGLVASTDDADVPPDNPSEVMLRALARDAALAGESLDTALLDQESWLLELLPSGSHTPIARYLKGIYDLRPDIRYRLPQIPGIDALNFARWALDYGVQESDWNTDLIRAAAEKTLSAQPELDAPGTVRPPGVNLIGYLSGEIGLGTSARLLDAALVAAQIPTSVFPVMLHQGTRTSAAHRDTQQVRHDITLFAVNGSDMQGVSAEFYDVADTNYRIGYWYWETENFPPSQQRGFADVDEVWVATDFVRDAISKHSAVPVRTVMPPLPQKDSDPPPTPAGYGIPTNGRPWFLFVFDYFSGAERKNPWGVIAAFTRAFPVNSGPMLVIKTINAKHRPREAQRLRQLTETRPDIIVIDDYLTAQELSGLYANCTAFISLHRAEGLGLTIAEAMAWGKPVIVSDYSGNLQFTTAANSFLVPCRMVPIPPNIEPYSESGGNWADPDIDIAAQMLQLIVMEPERALAIGKQASSDIATLHNPEVAGKNIAAALTAARVRASEIALRSLAADEQQLHLRHAANLPLSLIIKERMRDKFGKRTG